MVGPGPAPTQINLSTLRYYHALTGERLGSVAREDALRIDNDGAGSCLVGPALFDPQVNGFAGVDFQDPQLDRDALEWAVLQIRRAGCAHILLTLITHPAGFLETQLARVDRLLSSSDLLTSTIVGVHLEGPFLRSDEGYIGIHGRENAILPDWGLFERLQRASGGRIRMLTLAPELPGAMDLIRRASAAGVWVALGHTDASVEELFAAARAGARSVTHLGNGCPTELPRHDNIIHRVLGVPELLATLIPDGIHIPPPALANLTRLLGPARFVATTDSISAAASPPGSYTLGEVNLEVGEDQRAVHPNGRNLAGSSLRMIDGLFNLMRFGGVDAAGAWRAWTFLRDRMLPGIDAPPLIVPFPMDPAGANPVTRPVASGRPGAGR